MTAVVAVAGLAAEEPVAAMWLKERQHVDVGHLV